VREIRLAAPPLAVDLEGLDLSRDGRITLLQMATATKVYLVDVLVLGPRAFEQGLRDLLEDPTVEKLMFDCRQDSDALFYQYVPPVTLRGVWDLQMAEVYLRIRNRLPADGLAVYYKDEGVKKLRGLEECMRRYGKSATMAEAKRLIHDEFVKDPQLWATRPLSPAAIQYAAGDVAGLLPIAACFAPLLTEDGRAHVSSMSDLYTDFFRGKKTRSFDGYESHGLLPFGIFRPFDKGCTTTPCAGCGRDMPISNQYIKIRKRGSGGLAPCWCHVCREVNLVHVRTLTLRLVSVCMDRAFQIADRVAISAPEDGVLRCDGCRRCGDSSHLSRDCPWRRTVVCYCCHEQGHMARECPVMAAKGTPRPSPPPARPSRNFVPYHRRPPPPLG